MPNLLCTKFNRLEELEFVGVLSLRKKIWNIVPKGRLGEAGESRLSEPKER
jgi:hypothetical protein